VTPKRTEKEHPDRLPPGQYLVRDFPVLHVGDVPKFDPGTWRLSVFGAVERPLELSWDQFTGLPTKIVKTDIHCVTRWTKLDTIWEGVPFGEIANLAGVKPTATYVVTHAANGYTANVPLEEAMREDALLAYKYEGQPLEPIHGGPMRMFVPTRYFWKSTKWCNGVEFRDKDEPGFWEVRGYNNNADPWKEERYW
jgi:DMSO/TMAO reductase YedYZ molybdopterin-dependent catalytic subunit